jgi:hypothetical protein
LPENFSGVLAEQQPTSQFLAALNYLVPQLMLDFGGTVGMNTITDDWRFR